MIRRAVLDDYRRVWQPSRFGGAATDATVDDHALDHLGKPDRFLAVVDEHGNLFEADRYEGAKRTGEIVPTFFIPPDSAQSGLALLRSLMRLAGALVREADAAWPDLLADAYWLLDGRPTNALLRQRIVNFIANNSQAGTVQAVEPNVWKVSVARARQVAWPST